MTLTVTDDQGATGTVTIDVSVGGNEPPVASFTWRASDNDPLTVEFDGSSSTDDKGIDTYGWDFGDGERGTGETPPPHTYDSGGTYQVTLTVTDTEDATDSETQDVQVGVCSAPLSASASPRTLARVAARTLCALVVTTNGDEPDPDLEDGRCDVDPDADGDQCTLRAAIQEANSPNRPDADAIFFDIDGSPEIVVGDPLPAITGQTTVNGSTQAGVVIDAGGGRGLVVEASGSVVRDLAVVNAAPAGIELAGTGGHTLDGVLAGLAPGGAQRANETGVWVRSAGNTLTRVVASGNAGVGVLVEGSGNRLENVVAGLTPNASSLAPNRVAGLVLRGDTNTVTGGVFTGNGGAQISVDGDGNELDGVIAGLSGDGATVVPGQTRSAAGIAVVGGSGTTIGGAKVHGQAIGVLLGGGRAHRVEGSRITGASVGGIVISRSAVNEVVGNVIVAADGGLAGVLVSVAPEGSAPPTSDSQPTEDNLVQANVLGAQGIGNPSGVLVNGAARTVIVGNWIAGNNGPGVSVIARDGTPSGTVVKSNAIGLQTTGSYEPNRGPGVFVDGGTGATIGGTGDLDPNLIAYNNGPGVLVSTAATATRILRNQIVGNTGLGIEAGGSDAAAAPEVPLVTPDRAGVRIRGTTGSTHRVEVFANDACDPSGAGEGAQFVGTATVVVGSGGVGTAEIAFASPVAPGTQLTATTTPVGRSTSPFSRCAAVAASARLTAPAVAGATRLEVASAGLVGRVVDIGTGSSVERNYGVASGSLVLARSTRFAHASGDPVVAVGDTLFVSVDKGVVTRSSRLPDVAVLIGRLRAIQGRNVACGEDVRLTLDGDLVAQRVAGTRFVRQSGNRCVFVAKTENGIGRLELDLGKGTWTAEIVRRDLERLTNPVEVGLEIGDDAGSETLRFRADGAIWTYAR